MALEKLPGAREKPVRKYLNGTFSCRYPLFSTSLKCLLQETRWDPVGMCETGAPSARGGSGWGTGGEELLLGQPGRAPAQGAPPEGLQG